MVEALRRKGIPVGYLLFSGEQHGFRQGGNIRRALDADERRERVGPSVGVGSSFQSPV